MNGKQARALRQAAKSNPHPASRRRFYQGLKARWQTLTGRDRHAATQAIQRSPVAR